MNDCGRGQTAREVEEKDDTGKVGEPSAESYFRADFASVFNETKETTLLRCVPYFDRAGPGGVGGPK